MRIYIIGNDGITLCREPPTAVNEGEIVVASQDEAAAANRGGRTHVGAAIARFKRAGRIEERDGKLYAT